MKKTCLVIFFLFLLFFNFPSSALAACDPPNDYSDCPELRPDLNIDLLDPVPITGVLDLNDFWGGETDTRAPQFSTLIYGNPTPAVTSLYQLHYWDWQNNQVGHFVPPPSNLDLTQYDFATLVGFSTYAGQSILVPDSGYDIGQGNEVMVLYADATSLTLKYTGDDNVFVGYTLYLENIQVNPELLAYYNELNAAGRVELPVLMAGMPLGVAIGPEILVAIRDTGSFMDPRWLLAWWQTLDPGLLLQLLLMAFPAGQFMPPTFSCNPANPGDTDSRPVRCDACNETNMLTPSCATSFTVHDTVKHECCDANFFCDNEAWVIRDWGGIVTIDPSEITIPFVGKKGMEDEQRYLADYFEGTGFYYRPPYDFSTPIERRRVIEEGGVWRKLAPQTLQDKYKKDMVARARKSLMGTIQEGAIHDYLVEYKGESARLSEFAGNFPPDDPIDRLNWEKNTKWGRLWKAVPMFSREDTKGYIYPYLGARPADTFTIINPAAQVEKVPHMARLYEVTQAINKTLWPLIQGSTQGASQIQEKINTLIASAEEKVSGEQTEIKTNQQVLAKETDRKLLAQVGCKFLYDNNPPGQPPDCSCCSRIKENGEPDCRGRDTGEGGLPIPKMGLLCGWLQCRDGTPDFCGGVPQAPPAEPGCGFPGPLPVKSCQMDSITDKYPNDDLCCSPILIDLYAVDTLLNPDYWECLNAPDECKPIPDCIPPIDPNTGLPCYECCEICKDPCKREFTRSVKRKIGINLLHPYLYEAWKHSTDLPNGFFNIFRLDPDIVSNFEELAAHSQDNVDYSYSSGGVSPSEGYFYYPYLGGIQKAKEWVVNKALHVITP